MWAKQGQPNLKYLANACARFGPQPSLTVYKRWTKGSRPLLRFSKTGDRNIEEAYARHFVFPRKKGCPFEEGAIEVGNSAEIPPARRSSARREILEGQVQRS
jgi:hypothetical protein